MMTRRLVEVRKNYFISSEYELCAPLPGERPYDAFLNGFNLSTNALDAGLRFSLHPVIEACLKGWQILPSQMAPNSWRYLVAFLWECFGSDITVTRDLFIVYFCLSQGQAGYYLTAHAGFRVGEIFNLGKMKSGGGAGSRSAASPTTGVSTSAMAAESLANKWPSVDEGLSLRKHSQRETPKHQAKASGSTTRVLSGKGKELIAMEEAPE
ncbi:hypothetical protein BHM03_00036843 [Ensete ventricosum]|nr:hypothetical protein BHM03_00036843 [Ensete ventricosum]